MTNGNKNGETRFNWFIPIDGAGAGTTKDERPPYFDYLRPVVQTAEVCGFYISADPHPVRQRPVRRGCSVGRDLDHCHRPGRDDRTHPIPYCG